MLAVHNDKEDVAIHGVRLKQDASSGDHRATRVAVEMQQGGIGSAWQTSFELDVGPDWSQGQASSCANCPAGKTSTAGQGAATDCTPPLH